jgi:hypothetical protein
MDGMLSKMAPTAVVLAVAMYCGWPAGEDAAPTKAAAKKSSVTSAQLSPARPPSPKRDPFLAPVREQVVQQKKATGQPEKKATVQMAKKTAPVERKTDPAAKLRGLSLKGTFISGPRRLALIDGKFYSVGDLLKVKEVSATVTEVEPERVVLLHEGERLELKYTPRVYPPVSTNTARRSGAGSPNTAKRKGS